MYQFLMFVFELGQLIERTARRRESEIREATEAGYAAGYIDGSRDVGPDPDDGAPAQALTPPPDAKLN